MFLLAQAERFAATGSWQMRWLPHDAVIEMAPKYELRGWQYKLYASPKLPFDSWDTDPSGL